MLQAQSVFTGERLTLLNSPLHFLFRHHQYFEHVLEATIWDLKYWISWLSVVTSSKCFLMLTFLNLFPPLLLSDMMGYPVFWICSGGSHLRFEYYKLKMCFHRHTLMNICPPPLLPDMMPPLLWASQYFEHVLEAAIWDLFMIMWSRLRFVLMRGYPGFVPLDLRGNFLLLPRRRLPPFCTSRPVLLGTMLLVFLYFTCSFSFVFLYTS